MERFDDFIIYFINKFQITTYLGKRDFIDHGEFVDLIGELC